MRQATERRPRLQRPNTTGQRVLRRAPTVPFAGKRLQREDETLGTEDDLVATGVEQGGAIIERWAKRLSDAVGPWLGVAPVEDEAAAIDVLELAQPIAETAMRAQMLGALDADAEMKAAGVEPPVKLEYPEHLKAVPKFTMKPFQEAIDDFDQRRVVTRATFDKMAATAKARAFTVAGLAKKDLVQTVRDQLKQSIIDGDDRASLSARSSRRAKSLAGGCAPGRQRKSLRCPASRGTSRSSIATAFAHRIAAVKCNKGLTRTSAPRCRTGRSGPSAMTV